MGQRKSNLLDINYEETSVQFSNDADMFHLGDQIWLNVVSLAKCNVIWQFLRRLI